MPTLWILEESSPEEKRNGHGKKEQREAFEALREALSCESVLTCFRLHIGNLGC